MISKTAEYALRAVLFLARKDEEGTTRATDIAQGLRLPANYLSKILHTLGREGVLESERGRNGGFRLARPASGITLAEVVEPFEELGERRECLLGRSRCSDAAPCVAHQQWKDVSQTVLDFFKGTRITDLLDEGADAAIPTGTNGDRGDD